MCKCNKCIKCCKRGKHGPTGPTGSTGPTGTINCVDQEVTCINPGDKVLIQRDRIEGFNCEFAPDQWTISGVPPIVFNSTTLTMSVNADFGSVSTSENLPCSATLSFHWEVNPQPETEFSYVLNGNQVILYPNPPDLPTSGDVSVPLPAGLNTIAFNITGNNAITATVTNFLVVFDCCRIVAAPITLLIPQILEFSDNSQNLTGGSKHIGKNNTSTLSNPDDAFFEAAFMVNNNILIGDASLVIKQNTLPSDNSGMIVNLKYSRPILGSYKNINVVPLFNLSNITSKNSYCNIQTKVQLFKGDLVAISLEPNFQGNSWNSMVTLSTSSNMIDSSIKSNKDCSCNKK